MCARYVSVQKVSTIEKRFNVTAMAAYDFEPSYNIGPGKLAPVITSNNPKELQLLQFGMTPFWAKKKMYLFNARAEGDGNKENAVGYNGGKGIITKSSFRKPIRSQRCLVIADAFIEGPKDEKLSKPYVVYLRDNVRPFSFAGIWDVWKDENGEDLHSFAIITTTANTILQEIGHDRSPVIIPRNRETSWLNTNLPLADITRYLEPYPSKLMNAYPVSKEVKNPKADGRHLIEPIGQRIEREYEIKEAKDINVPRMGQHKRRFGQ